jgi:ferredoxin
MQIPTVILIVLSISTFLGYGGFALSSYKEGESRASTLALVIAITGGAFLLVWILTPIEFQIAILVLILLIIFIGSTLFMIPIGQVDISKDTPQTRFDERDIMFARARLVPDSPEFLEYYTDHPENLEPDTKTRAKPGLLSPESMYADPYLFASPIASFTLTEALNPAVDGPISNDRHNLSLLEMSTYVKNLAKYFGALDVGVTDLKPYHVYSHIGRGAGKYGDPIPIDHKNAIAFTVEMDFDMIGANPKAQGVMESARQYVESARVAVQLAAAIRYLGYPARAHIDGNYHVICPLVARDAGLGEIGRMGLLMTPRQGPRVRLGVVTTDLPLLSDERIPDSSVIDFCSVCLKCAQCCPSKSIPFDDRQETDGALRWRIDPDTCFRYWNTVGTDCGRCMTVCPYSHPDITYHNLIRWGISKSGTFRRVAVRLDDKFYGVKPAIKDPPKWTRMG